MCGTINKLYNETASSSDYFEDLFLNTVEVLMNFAFALVKTSVSVLISVAIALITFAVNIYLGTITCLSTALIHGTLDCLAEILQVLSDTIQKAVNGILKEFNVAMGGLSKAINLVVLVFDSFKSLLGSSNPPITGTYETTVSKVNLTVSSLKNITLPTSYIDEIKSFANSIPDFEDVLSNLSSLITLPLHHLAQELNQTQLKFEPLTRSTQKNGSFISYNIEYVNCGDINRKFMAAMRITEATLTTVIIMLSIATAALAILLSTLAYFNCLRKMELLEKLSSDDDPVSIGNHIQAFDFGIWSRIVVHVDPYTKWFLCFSFFQSHCLEIGCLGFLTVWLQYLLLQVVRRELQVSLGEFPSNGDFLTNQATQFVANVQRSINSLIDTLNSDLFSSIKETSSGILAKLTEFQSESNQSISSVFNGTPFAAPLRTIVYCTVGRKVDDVETGLSWIIHQLNIPVPQVLEALQKTQALANTANITRNASTPQSSLFQSINECYQKTERIYYQNLEVEIIIFSVLVGIWIFYSLIGGIEAWRRRIVQTTPEYEIEISWPKRIENSYQKQYPGLDSLPHSSSSNILSRK